MAVGIVLVAHGLPGTPVQAAGSVGVALFFVLSGFLITRLLVEESDRTGGIDLRSFYLRRARRLLPALPFALALCALANWMRGGPIMEPIVAAVTYTSNWAQIDEGHKAFGHLWSLGVEEQFYLLWPLVLVLLPRRHLGPVAVAGACAVLALRLVESNQTLAYEGTHLRIDAMLIGAALAVLARPTVIGRGLVVAAVTIGAVFCWDATFPIMLGAGATLVALASGVLVLAALPVTHRRPMLEHLGRISYGAYLFHAPIRAMLEGRVPLPIMFVATVGGGIVLAEVSWRCWESRWLSAPVEAQVRAGQPVARRREHAHDVDRGRRVLPSTHGVG